MPVMLCRSSPQDPILTPSSNSKLYMELVGASGWPPYTAVATKSV